MAGSATAIDRHARQRIETVLRESGLDAVVAISPENVRYSAGVEIATQRIIRDRLAIVLWPAAGDAALVVCNIEEGYTRERSWITDVRTYLEHTTSPIAVLADAIRGAHLERARIGIELTYLTANYWDELKAALPQVTFVPSEPVFAAARMLKSPEERALLAEGSRKSEQALLATYLCVKPGDTERLLAERLTGNLLAAGADSVAFLYMPAGSNTRDAHPPSTDYAVRPGDLIKADFGGWFSGYISDRARTMVVGRPEEWQSDMHARLAEAHRNAIDFIRAGVRATDVFAFSRSEYKRLMIPFDPPHAGHGIGLAVHEAPMLAANDVTELRSGMMLAIETRVRVPGKHGLHIEDLVEITPDGRIVHTDAYPFERLVSV
jgi:Xaa-Pro aminopeptidase